MGQRALARDDNGWKNENELGMSEDETWPTYWCHRDGGTDIRGG